MTDAQLQKKLNQLVKLSHEVNEEAQRRWPDGSLFYESEGYFYVMEEDNCGSSTERQKFVRFQSDSASSMGCGAW